MANLNDPKLLRAIIMDHYEHPHNKGLVSDSEGYLSLRSNSESCIDDITMQVKIKDGIIEDIKFDGHACTISTASTSILTDQVKGKSVQEALKIIENYENMVFEKPFDSDLAQESVAFKNVGKQANRIKCAVIGYDALKELIKQSEKE